MGLLTILKIFLEMYPLLVSHHTLRAPEVDTIYKRPSYKRSATVFRCCAFLRVRKKQEAEKRLVITRTAQNVYLLYR